MTEIILIVIVCRLMMRVNRRKRKRKPIGRTTLRQEFKKFDLACDDDVQDVLHDINASSTTA